MVSQKTKPTSKPKVAKATAAAAPLIVERVQTGVKLETRMLKVLKALAEYHDITLGDLLEGIVLHAFEGKSPFERATLAKIEQLKQIYAMNYDSSFAHNLKEQGAPS
ncbi:MAG: hypothetical protein ABL931_10680 [Usitatibacteraceae bacterium]